MTRLTVCQAALTDANAKTATLQGQVTALQAAVAADAAMITSLKTDLVLTKAALADCQSHLPAPDPTPDPTPSAQPLLGSSAATWSTDKPQFESTGGKLQASRLFFTSLTNDPTTGLKNVVAQGVSPVASFKPGNYTWAQIADGAADAAITTLAKRVKAAVAGRRTYLVLHHEPDKQSDPNTVGEGGTGADFGRMQARWSGLIKAVDPTLQVGTIMNGWWFSSQARGFTPAQFQVWLPPSVCQTLDFIAADDYTDPGGEKAVTRTKNRVALLSAIGFHGYTGTGETNAPYQDPNPADFRAVFDYAKTEPRFHDGFVCLWNGPLVGNYKPVQETGLLDDFQDIVKNWA